MRAVRPLAGRGAREALLQELQAVRVHEDDHARGNAGCAARSRARGHRSGGRPGACRARARAHARAGRVSAPGTALAGHAAAVAVDVAVFTVRAGLLEVLLVQVRGGPFAGAWALPGGRVHEDESLDDAAARELLAQAAVRNVYLEQLYTFGHPRRDPHDRVVSVAYVGLVADPDRVTGPATAGKYEAVCWRPAARLPVLAYDHGAVVRLAVARLRAKLQYTNLAFTLLPAAFTLGELQSLYESILGRRLDRRNFRRKVLSLGLLRPLGRLRRGPHRPAALYAFRSHRPMTVSVL